VTNIVPALRSSPRSVALSMASGFPTGLHAPPSPVLGGLSGRRPPNRPRGTGGRLGKGGQGRPRAEAHREAERREWSLSLATTSTFQSARGD